MSHDLAAGLSQPDDRLERAVDWLCRAFAFIGGAILLGITLLSVASIIGRSLVSAPIAGDFELVQVGCAVCVACFMPLCQLRGGNIIVDFFTTAASKPVRAGLDAVGALLVALMMGLVAWRTGAGAVSAYGSAESTMIRAFPIWVAYALMTPALATAALAGLYSALKYVRGARG